MQIRAFPQGGYGNVFCAYAIATAPVIYTTAAGTGGPLLWNPPASKISAVLLAATYSLSIAATVAGALGITGNTGQNSAPGSTTPIDSVANLLIGGSAPSCSVYRVGTVASAGNFFMPIGMVHTGALTTDTTDDNFIDLGAAVIVPPGAWVSLAASATLTTAVMQMGLIWAEVPA